jgi:hypothetical protein
MNAQLIAQLDKEISATRAQLQALETARKALAGVNGTSPAPSAPRAANATGAPQKRAPAGYLEDAMEKAIKAKPGLTNGDVRKTLEKSGYAFSLTPLHIGKRLSAMVEEKRLSLKLDGNKRRYFPAK